VLEGAKESRSVSQAVVVDTDKLVEPRRNCTSAEDERGQRIAPMTASGCAILLDQHPGPRLLATATKGVRGF